MPVLDGIEAIRQLRADPALAVTRLVVLTTFGLDDYVFDALRASADAFLVKDIEPDELLRSIHRVAAGDAVISPTVTRALIDDFLTRSPPRHGASAPDLTSRERDVLAGVCRGHSNREIARDLGIGEATVKTYVSRLLDKFAVVSRVGLVVAARERGLTVFE
jgi:DNA-binding NarL/FixJ family response regulator